MFELQLIEEVKKYECIFNKNHIDFRNKCLKEKAWNAIEEAVGKSEEKCRLRWKTLRDRYVKEYLRMTASKKYKSTWRFTKAMSFMRNYMDSRIYYREPEVISEGEMPTNGMPHNFEYNLIAELKKCPFIYDKDHPDFRNRLVKEDAWVSIAEVVGAPNYQCRNRWKTLRDRFVAEHIKMNSNPEYKSQWKYIDDMSFMTHHVDTRPKSKVIRKSRPNRFEKILIAEVQKRSVLYDRDHSDFRTKIVKQQAWKEIAQAVGITKQQCRNRWKSLRDRFVIEFIKMIRSQDYTSPWRYMEAMSFMKSYVTPKIKYEDLTKRDMFCRTCLKVILNESGPRSESLKIFETLDLAEKLSQCCNLPIAIHDEYPDSVCMECYEQILHFHEFQQMCCDSLDNFKEIVLEDQSEGKYDDYFDGSMDSNGSCTLDSSNITYIERVDENEYRNSLETSDELNDLSESIEGQIEIESDDIELDESGKDDPLAEPLMVDTFSEDDNNSGEEQQESQRSNADDTAEPESMVRIRYKCEICPIGSKFQCRLKAHQRYHLLLRDYPCTQGKCQRSFTQFELLQKHLKDHNNLQTFKCNIGNCERLYKSQANLTQHRIKIHNWSREKKNKYVCEVCGKIFTSTLSLKNHHYVHLDKSQWPYACDVEGCTQRFKVPHLMKLHKNRHYGIKNHVCPYCGLRTVTLAELNTHINVHTFERKYTCPFCPKVCKSSGVRGSHIRRVHQNAQILYPCSICDGKFTSAYNRDNHEMAHRGIKPYSCDQCNKQFKWKMGLTMHMKIIHMGHKPYECDVCGKEFRWYGSLTKHKQSHTIDNVIEYMQEGANDFIYKVAENIDKWPEEDSELFQCTFDIVNNTQTE